MHMCSTSLSGQCNLKPKWASPVHPQNSWNEKIDNTNCDVGGNVNWQNHFEKTIWFYLLKLRAHILSDVAILSVSMYTTKMHTHVH